MLKGNFVYPKIYALLLVIITLPAIAQKGYDYSIRLITPANNSSIVDSLEINFKFSLINTGTTPIAYHDTILGQLVLDSFLFPLVDTFTVTKTINPGDSEIFQNIGTTWPAFNNGDVKFCYFVSIPNNVDSTPIDDTSCSIVHMIQSPPASIESQKKTTASIYPNPVSNYLTVNSSNPAKICFYDISGKRLLEYHVNKNDKVDVSMFASGIYFYRLYDSLGLVVDYGRLLIYH